MSFLQRDTGDSPPDYVTTQFYQEPEAALTGVNSPFLPQPQPQTQPQPKPQTSRIEQEDSIMSSSRATQTKIGVGVGVVIAVVIAAIVVAICISSIHTIDEGHVGVYYKFGALQDNVTGPGMHYMMPLVVSFEQVLIRPETDTIKLINAITKDGIQISFEGVQVISLVHQEKAVQVIKKYGIDFKRPLVFDRVKEDIKIFCANNTIDDVYNTRFLDIVAEVKDSLIQSISRLGKGGVDILNLVIPKPDIPQDIANNYKQVKVQWTETLVAIQQQKTESIKKETEKIRAIADAERTKEVLAITIMESILKQEGEQNITRIANAIAKEKEENMANIEKYKLEKQAEANSKLYTPEYVKLTMAQSLSNNTKFYFSGDQSPLGSLLSKIIN